MPKVESQISEYAQNYPLKRETFNNSVQFQVGGSNQQPNADPPSSQENPTFAFSPLAYYTYTTVNLSMLIYGLSRANLPLLYIACIMAAAPASPSVLKLLVSLVKENFLLKGSGK